jgi:hypothetical protein
MVEHIEGQRDLITHKSIWHLSDRAIKNVCKFFFRFFFFFSHSFQPTNHYISLGVSSVSLISSSLLVDVFYLMFTCWGCLFFGSMKVSPSGFAWRIWNLYILFGEILMSEFLLYRTHIMTQRRIEKMEGMAVDIGYMTRYMCWHGPSVHSCVESSYFMSFFFQ